MFNARLIYKHWSVFQDELGLISLKKLCCQNVRSCEQKKTLKLCHSNPILTLGHLDNQYNRTFSQCIQDMSRSQQDVQEDSTLKLDTKVLKMSIIGTPNSGKSTFINQIVGRRVSCIEMMFDP